MSARLIDARALRAAALRPPPSKSDAQRALLLAHARALPAPALGPLDEQPADVRSVAAALTRLDAPGPIEIDCGDGAAPLRFLVAQAALREGETRFVGSARLGARPHRALFEALRRGLGATIDEGAPWPLVVRGVAPPAAAHLHVAADESSQPLSALLLLAAAIAARGGRCTVEATTAIASAGYVELTLRWLRDAGVGCARDGRGGRFTVAGLAPATLPSIPADWSSIGYLLPCAWASGGWVEGVADVAHPDRAVLAVLAAVGLDVAIDGGRASVRGSPSRGLDFAVAAAPDLAPTLAALACVLPAPSTLSSIAILRHKESDRIAGVTALVAAGGGRATRDGDALRIEPGAVPAALAFSARGDHRLAMAAATLAVVARRRLVLDDAEHVAKSFPGFFGQLERIGVRDEGAAVPAQP